MFTSTFFSHISHQAVSSSQDMEGLGLAHLSHL
jgi:hypothetical protein